MFVTMFEDLRTSFRFGPEVFSAQEGNRECFQSMDICQGAEQSEDRGGRGRAGAWSTRFTSTGRKDVIDDGVQRRGSARTYTDMKRHCRKLQRQDELALRQLLSRKQISIIPSSTNDPCTRT